MGNSDLRHNIGRGQQIIRIGHAQRLTGFAILHPLEKSCANPVRYASQYLAVHDLRVENSAAIVDDGVADDFDTAGFRIDFNFGNMGATRKRRPLHLEIAGCEQSRGNPAG